MGGWRRTTACERTRRWISLHLDGEISDLESAALTRHLGRCEECAVLAREVTGLTLLLRAAPLAEPQRPLSVAPGRARRARPARRRAAVAAAFVVSLGSAFAILSLPSPSGLLVPSSALRFADAQQEIEFAQSKNLTLEPLLDSVASVEVPVFSHRALR